MWMLDFKAVCSNIIVMWVLMKLWKAIKTLNLSKIKVHAHQLRMPD